MRTFSARKKSRNPKNLNIKKKCGRLRFLLACAVRSFPVTSAEKPVTRESLVEVLRWGGCKRGHGTTEPTPMSTSDFSIKFWPF